MINIEPHTIEYIAIQCPATRYHREAVAQARVDGRFFGNIYPFAVSDINGSLPPISLTFIAADDQPLTVDLWPESLDRMIRTLVHSLPPF